MSEASSPGRHAAGTSTSAPSPTTAAAGDVPQSLPSKVSDENQDLPSPRQSTSPADPAPTSAGAEGTAQTQGEEDIANDDVAPALTRDTGLTDPSLEAEPPMEEVSLNGPDDGDVAEETGDIGDVHNPETEIPPVPPREPSLDRASPESPVERDEVSTPPLSGSSSALGLVATTMGGGESLSARRQQSVEPIQVTAASPVTPSERERERAHTPHSGASLSPARLTPQLRDRHTPTTPEFITSPRYRTIEIQSQKDDGGSGSDEGDVSGKFENVSLDAAAPSTSPSTTSAKLRDVVDGKPSVPASVAVRAASPAPNGRSESVRSQSLDTSSLRSGGSTPRRHAPPAHPHPFPIPTSPTPAGAPVPQVTAVPSDGGSSSSAPAPQPPLTQGLGVKGLNTMEKFMSRTRPQHLPPKDKTEDEAHLHQWETMMAKSREHELERQKQAETRRLQREKHLQIVTPHWEELLSSRDFSIAKVKSDHVSRKLWFEGIPPHLRGKAWSLAIGNPLAMHKDAYKGYLRRAQRAMENGRFPQDILDSIEEDLDATFPTLHVFQRGSPVRDELRDLVCAWVVYRSDVGRGYAPYITLLAAMFHLVSPPTEAFLSLCNFLSRPTLHAFYTDTRDEIDAFYRVFENLQADTFPRIYANCKNLGLRLPESYFRSVLVEQVPFDAACRLWDQIVLEGDGYIFRAALAIFGFLEPRLYYPDKDEIESVLEGRNAATMAITERERERARLRGEKYEESLDGKLSVFGLHEDALFDWLAKDEWKDSRFDRLVVRELPD